MLREHDAADLRDRAHGQRWSALGQRLGVLLVDVFCLGIATAAALYGRNNLSFFDPRSDVTELLAPLAALIIVVWLDAIALSGGYQSRQFGVGTVEYRRLLTASLLTAAALGVGAYLFQYPMSRGFYFLLFIVGIPLLLLGRLIFRRAVHRARRQGRLMTSVLVAGDSSHVDDVVAVLARERWLGYSVVGALVADSSDDETKGGVPVFGKPDDAVTVIRATGANGVIFAEGSFQRGQHFNELARQLEDEQAQMMVVPALTDVSAERMDIRPVAGMPIVYIERPQAQAARQFRKRAFDLVGSSVLIVLFSPVLLAVALAVRLSSPGPVLFKQVRAGLKGQPFKCFKFRSMVVDAEAKLAELRAKNEADGVLFKMANDPRVTSVGRFLRRFSLDELPQLFNVWLGQMSLIGPRPALLSEVQRYQDHVMRRLDVRPGMTGLWQVSGRSDLSWEDTVRLDLYYVDNWSMVQDLSILAKMFGAVIGKNGAY